MQYRRFGKTNRQLSVFSLGLMRCLSSAATLQNTVERALEWGINHLETARGYGKSESYLGLALKGKDRSQLCITTKLTPTLDANQTRSAIEESLTRLQLDYLDCVAVHGVNTWEHLESLKNPHGCMQALRKAVEQGKIRHLGFSTHAPLEIIIETINTDFFEFINIHYYYFFQRHAPALELASAKDMGIFIISPADKGGRLYTPPEQLKSLCYPLTPLEFNYRFLLSDRRLTTLSIGPATPEELDQSLQVSDHTGPLTATEQEIIAKLEQQIQQQLATDLCRQCHQCLPCPEGINIPQVLRLRNLTIAYNMTDFGQYRYGMFEKAGHWFPGRKGDRCTDCGDCLPRCPENLDIPKLLRDTHQRLNGKSGRRLWE